MLLETIGKSGHVAVMEIPDGDVCVWIGK